MCKLSIIFLLVFASYMHATAQTTEFLATDSVGNYIDKCRVGYRNVEKEISKISQELPKRKWKGIIAIARGGLYPSLILAYKLDINRVDAISLASYNEDKKQGDIKLLQDFNFKDKNQGEGWLVVDDLVDSGKTVEWLRQRLPKAYYVVIYAKPQGKAVVDKHGMEVPQTTWITFPWDNEFSLDVPKCKASQKNQP